MASEVGKKITCDRCKRNVFLKYIGTDSTDGGLTRNDNFEKEPAGWRYVSDIGTKLCPACTIEFSKLVNKFMNYIIMEEDGKVRVD